MPYRSMHDDRRDDAWPNTAAFCSRRDNSGAEKNDASYIKKVPQPPRATQTGQRLDPPHLPQRRRRRQKKQQTLGTLDPGVTVCMPLAEQSRQSARFSPKETDGRNRRDRKGQTTTTGVAGGMHCAVSIRSDQLLIHQQASCSSGSGE